MKRFQKLMALLLALVMVLSCVGASFATAPKAESDDSTAKIKEVNGGFRTKPTAEIKGYKDSDIVRVIVILEDAPEADVAVRGTKAANAQRDKLLASHKTVKANMSGIKFNQTAEYTAILNGFAGDVAYGDIAKIAAIKGVKSVHISNIYEAPVLETPVAEKMYYSNIFTGVDSALDNYGTTGAGMVIAVLDTGLNTEHEAFQDADGACATYGTFTEDMAALAVAPGKYINAKVPFAYDYADFDDDVTDTNGHGTHVSGIAVGSTYIPDEGVYPFYGAASDAQLVSMKIFYSDEETNGTGTSSDIYFAALEDCYRMGVDVINMSIGSPAGFNYDDELGTVIFGNIFARLDKAGIVCVNSCGNEDSMAANSYGGGYAGYVCPDYQDYGLVGSPATYAGNTSVASLENYAYPTLVLETDAGYVPYVDSSIDEVTEIEGLWMKAFADQSVDYVLVAPVSDNASVAEELQAILGIGTPEDFAAADVKDKIAVVSRGDITFEEKIENAYNAGAVGCIIVNNEVGSIGLAIETWEIPAVSISLADAPALVNATELKVSSPSEKQDIENENAFLMSDFSSWGTSPKLTLDPMITSIGGMVNSASITGNDEYVVYSGTSMSSPNMAGIFANVLEFLKDNGVEKYEASKLAESLLYSTAEILTDAEGYPYSPRKQGSGLANPANALTTYTESFYVANPIQELGDDVKKDGVYTMELVVKNDSLYDCVALPVETVLYDYILSPDGETLLNTLTSDYLIYGDDYTVDYTIDGVDVSEGFEMNAGDEKTVTVTITLSEEAKGFFDETFTNGNFVEGYVEFLDVMLEGNEVVYEDMFDYYMADEIGLYVVALDENYAFVPVLDEGGNKIYAAEEDLPYISIASYGSSHATFLGFYGDWTKGDVLDKGDFMDYAEADYFVNTTAADEDGYTYADYGYTALDVLDCYTIPSMGYTAVMFGGAPLELVATLGDNLYTYEEYNEKHISFSTEETDGDYFYANGFYLKPSQLRNCRNLIMTVYNEETGEIYLVDNTEYLPKNRFYDGEGWDTNGVFYWDGTDADGELLPSGSIAKVRFDAVLPYKHADDTSEWDGTMIEDIWSFNVEVDYTAPVIEDAVFDPEAKTLTVTAKDESYLANILLSDGADVLFDGTGFSSDKEGESFTATFDVSEIIAEGYTEIYVSAVDYATNEKYELVSIEIPTTPVEEIFDDVEADDWFRDFVQFAVDNGLMKGVKENEFDPDGALTRAMLVTILYRGMDEPSVEGLENPFEDVEADQWYTDAIIWAANEGIVKGTSETTFEPNVDITREQIAAILYRFSGEPEVEDKLAEFPDGDTVSDYAKDAMSWAIAEGLIGGSDGKLLPLDTATRAEAAKILSIFVSLPKD